MDNRQELLSEISKLKQRIDEIEHALGVNGSSVAKLNAAEPVAPPTARPALPESVAMDATRIVMHQIVAPTEVDALGICFGGQVLSWIDVCAGLSAKTLARGPCVTISVDAVHFFRPCRRGDVVIIAAMVNRTFSSSMEVGVRVEAENMRTGERRHCCSAYLTFVSLNSRARAQQQQQQQQGIGSSQQQHQQIGSSTQQQQQGESPQQQQIGSSQQQQQQQQGGPPRQLQQQQVEPPQQQQQQQQQQQSGSSQQQQQLPRVVPNTSEQARIYNQAEVRRQQRLAARKAAKEDPQRAAAAAACRLKPITHREGCPTLPRALTLQADALEDITKRSSINITSPTTQMLQQQLQKQLGISQSASPAAQDDQQQQQQHQQQHQHQSDLQTPAAATAAAESSPWADVQYQQSTAAAAAAAAAAGERRVIPPSATTAYMTQSIMPQHANTLGITFGGQVMSWMEQCCYISASRLRGTHLLTAGMDSVTFAASTKVGDIMYITAQVSAIFTSSLEVMVSVFAETLAEGRVFHCADAFATLVIVDMQGAPVSIPFQLEPSTPAEKLRFQGTQQRRAERLAMRSTMAAVSSIRPGLDGQPLSPTAVESKRSRSLEVLRQV